MDPFAVCSATTLAADAPHRHEEDDVECVLVDQMLAIVASQRAESPAHTAAQVSRADVERIYREVHGDPSRVYDDVMTLLTVRALRLKEEQQHANSNRANETKLQWRELCNGLGLDECHEVFQVMEDMSDDERDAALSANGGFFQNLLWKLEEDERARDELEKTMALVQLLEEQEGGGGRAVASDDDDEHPLERLRRLFPDYKMHIIEDVYEAHGFDLDATAAALSNIGAVDQVKSFASVLKASGPTTMWRKNSNSHPTAAQPHAMMNSYDPSRPAIKSLGQFPVLPAKSNQRRGKGQHAKTSESSLVQQQRPPVANAWNASDGPVMETKLTTDLKLERLQRLLPSIDREVVRTTFFLNDGSSMATEAALREIFKLPAPEQSSVPKQALDDEDLAPVTTADAHVEDNVTYAECRARVDDCWHQLSDRYVAALRSFNRDHHIIANHRVRDISACRRALRAAQHEAAHAFVTAHLSHIRSHQALDLHGLTVVESLRVAREVIDLCRAERIRRCILICGVGNHSINQKARLLTAIQLSLEHRRIAFRKESGTVYIYPLRSMS